MRPVQLFYHSSVILYTRLAEECGQSIIAVAAVASLGGGATAPGDTLQEGDTRMKNTFMAKFRKTTTSEGGGCEETTDKTGHHFAKGDD